MKGKKSDDGFQKQWSSIEIYVMYTPESVINITNTIDLYIYREYIIYANTEINLKNDTSARFW